MSNNRSAKDIMTKEVFAVNLESNINCAEICAEAWHIRHVPVTDGKGRLVGMISTRDILEHITRTPSGQFTPVKEIMSEDPLVVAPTTSLAEIADLMRRHNIGAVPVVENQHLVGIVSERDFLKLI
ncbi:MAG: hypothetical protein DCC75_06305 [Proteobacteria bacterium]|nr:MAG: hypothetical protein DCC75_06305 [Pseudomonadota bacterium]